MSFDQHNITGGTKGDEKGDQVFLLMVPNKMLFPEKGDIGTGGKKRSLSLPGAST